MMLIWELQRESSLPGRGEEEERGGDSCLGDLLVELGPGLLVSLYSECPPLLTWGFGRGGY